MSTKLKIKTIHTFIIFVVVQNIYFTLLLY